MRRVFKLNQTSVEVDLKSLNRDAQDVIDLADLRPEPERLRVRQIVPIRFGAFLLILGVTGLGVGFAFQNELERHMKELAITIGVISLCGSVLILSLFGRKIEAVRFKNSQGICLLDVLKSGPDKAQYESFVSALIERIRAGSAGSEAAAPKKS